MKKTTVDEPTWASVAQPRRPIGVGTYMGEELAYRSNRPGAYDALQLPSLFNGRKSEPGAQKVLDAPRYVPPAPTPPANRAGPERNQYKLRTLTPGRRSLTPYKPRPLSAPSKVLEHLHEHGGCITYVEIAERFEIPQATITASFKPALKKGAFERHVVGGKLALALPGWVPPLPQAEDPEVVAARLAQRELAKATLKLWELHANAIKARSAFETQASRLRPLIPSENMPAL